MRGRGSRTSDDDSVESTRSAASPAVSAWRSTSLTATNVTVAASTYSRIAERPCAGRKQWPAPSHTLLPMGEEAPGGAGGVREDSVRLASVESLDSESEAGSARPFPWRGCLLAYSIIVCNAIALSAPVTFLPSMVEKRFHVAKDVEGNAVGLLVGAFSLAQFVSSFFVGARSSPRARHHLRPHIG